MCNVVLPGSALLVYTGFRIGGSYFHFFPLLSLLPFSPLTFSSSPSTPSIDVLSLLPSYSLTSVRVSGTGSFIRPPRGQYINFRKTPQISSLDNSPNISHSQSVSNVAYTVLSWIRSITRRRNCRPALTWDTSTVQKCALSLWGSEDSRPYSFTTDNWLKMRTH